MSKIKSFLKPSIELTTASILWGFGFIGTVWALRFLGSPAIIFYRFALAFVVGLGILFIFNRDYKMWKNEFRLSFWAGFWLGLTLILQTWGLITTTATKSSFITTLYVIIVPLLGYFFQKEKLHPLHFLFVGLAVAGTAMIVDFQWSTWSLGDSLTLANAFTAAFHILYVGKIAPRSQHHFAFNIFQSFWCALFALCLLALDTRWSLAPLDTKAWIGILSLGLGSSLFAFYIQVKAQKVLPPSLASLLFMMESPFSYFFAYLFLGERLNNLQSFGAGLIFFACFGATIIEQKRK